MDITKLLAFGVEQGASDCHLSAGEPPLIRIDGDLKKLESPPLSKEDVHTLVYDIMNDAQRKMFEQTHECDFSFELGQLARFRVNVFMQRKGEGAVFRTIPTKVLTLEELGMPPILKQLCDKEKGLILVTGPTGSGKSTTLAAMIDYLNSTFEGHILTVEDPIEFVHPSKKCLVNQRELGPHTHSFANALRAALREDPDVILVGEMRDRETFEAGLNAAETGHLVFGTVHSSTAPSTIGRILDLFPADMHPAMRQSLAFNLKAIVCQKLLPSIKPGVQRVPTNEIMIINPTIRELITKSEDKKLSDAIRIGFLEGMLDFTESLLRLVNTNLIDRATALEVAPTPEQLKMAFKGIKVATPGIL